MPGMQKQISLLCPEKDAEASEVESPDVRESVDRANASSALRLGEATGKSLAETTAWPNPAVPEKPEELAPVKQVTTKYSKKVHPPSGAGKNLYLSSRIDGAIDCLQKTKKKELQMLRKPSISDLEVVSPPDPKQ